MRPGTGHRPPGGRAESHASDASPHEIEAKHRTCLKSIPEMALIPGRAGGHSRHNQALPAPRCDAIARREARVAALSGSGRRGAASEQRSITLSMTQAASYRIAVSPSPRRSIRPATAGWPRARRRVPHSFSSTRSSPTSAPNQPRRWASAIRSDARRDFPDPEFTADENAALAGDDDRAVDVPGLD